MKAEKIRGLDTAELEQKMRELREQMFRLRFQMSMGQVDGLKKIRQGKRQMARILTELRARELQQAAK